VRYTIITPTLLRPHLAQACWSVNFQRERSWEHIVMVDTDHRDDDLLAKIAHPQRRIYYCERPHHDMGNTCRHDAWAHARGDYLYYLDDDNYLSETALADMRAVTAPWALVPIFGLDGYYFSNTPRVGTTDTGNMLIRRDIGRWKAGPEYAADGMLAEGLRLYPRQTFPAMRPVLHMPTANKGALLR